MHSQINQNQKMKRQIKIYFCALIALCAISCSRKSTQIIYQDKIVSHIDTITAVSTKYDTIPCNDFERELATNYDTVFVKVLDKKLEVKYVKKSDTIYRDVIIVQPAPLRQVNKVDNSVKNVAKKGSAIGDGNKITTKKNNWWWIFIAGVLSWFIVQNIIFRTLKIYIPILKFLP